MSKTLKLGWTALATLMSALALFATIITETEPNDTPATAQPVLLGDTIQGVINSDTDVDFFKYTLPEGTYIFQVEYPEGDPGHQDWIVVTDANGNEFPYACYHHGIGMISYIKICNSAAAYVKVFKNETFGLTNKPYQFTMVADADDPQECNDTRVTARPIAGPGVVVGKMAVKEDPDVLKFNAQPGIVGVAINTPQQPGLAFALDLYQGNNPSPVASTASGFDLNYTIASPGTYFLAIRYAQDTMAEYPYQASLLFTPDTCIEPAIGVINVQKSGRTVTLETLVQNTDSLRIAWGDGTVSDSLVHTYQNNGNYTITLTALNSCSTATATTTALVLTARFRLVPVENVIPGTLVKMALVCEEGEFQAATVQFAVLADTSKVQLSGLQSGTLNVTNLQKNTDLNSLGYGRVAGNFNPNGSETVSQGDTVFYLLINTVGALKGDSVAVDLNASLNFVFGAFILGAAEEIETALVPGSIEFVRDINFKINVATPTLSPVSMVEVTFTSADTVITALTNMNGMVDIILPYATQYTVRCKKDTFLLNGISPVDAFKINRAIVLLNNNNTTAYSYVAADFDCSGSISTIDAVKILQYIVGLINSPPCDQLVFIDAAHTFPVYGTNMATYFNFPTQIVATNPDPDQGVQMRFVCVVRGDYDHNSHPGFAGNDAESRDGYSEANFTYSSVAEDGLWRVQIRPEMALRVATGAFTLGYDATAYQLRGIKWMQGYPAEMYSREVAPGKVNVAFISAPEQNEQPDESAPLLELTFESKNRASATSLELALRTDGLAPEVSDAYGNLKSMTLERNASAQTVREPKFHFFPNPVINDLLVSLPERGDVQLTLFDVNGRVVLEQQTAATWQIAVPMQHLANGTYTCRLLMNNRIITKRIVLAH